MLRSLSHGVGVVCLASLATACAWQGSGGWPDASHHAIDSGLSGDAAAQPDAAVQLDAAAQPDAAAQLDAVVQPDGNPGVDAGIGADGGVQADGGAPTFGPLTYEAVANIHLVDNLHRVRWHPSGEFALTLGTDGEVGRYDAATGAVSLYGSLGALVADLDVAHDGAFFLVVGKGTDGVGRLWKISVDLSLQLSHTEEAQLTFGDPVAIELGPNHVDWAIGSTANTSLNYLQIWQDGVGLTNTKGFNTFGGLTDLMWGDPGLYAGSENVLLGAGWSGTDSMTWIKDTDIVVGNGWPGSFGNAGRAGWRPGGSFGMFTGVSSNKLYVYDGAWAMATLPVVGTAASPNAIAWTRDGYRAVIVGRALGSLTGTVIDFRPGTAATFNAADLHYAPIPNFDLAPFFANGNTHLLGVDWRPGSACSEGLMVGSDNGAQFNPTFGLIVRFYDINDPDC